jgi:cytochrome c-type biogenesis protein
VADTIRLIVLDANVLVAAAVALAAGFVSFASPCVLPLVPGYLSFVTGLAGETLTDVGGVGGASGAGGGGSADGGGTALALRTRGRLLAGSTLFVLGFAIPFALLGWAAGMLNLLERSALAQGLMGGIVVVLGVLLMRGRLVREARFQGRLPSGTLAGAPLLGFVFGVGWTPCLGPTAGAILTLSASVTGGVNGRGAFLGLMYALGLGLPFIVLAVGLGRLGRTLEVLRRHGRRLQLAGGGLLVLVGLAIATGLWSRWMIALRPLIQGVELPI